MKVKQVVLLAALIVVVAALVAVPARHAQAQAESQTVSGYLVDVKCASARVGEPGFPADHTKDCMLMDGCMKSGYGVMTADNKLVKFDAGGNGKALALLKATKREKDWKVTVKGTMKGGVLVVETIALQ